MIDEMVAVLKKDQADEVKSPHSAFEPARDRFLNHFFQRGTVLAHNREKLNAMPTTVTMKRASQRAIAVWVRFPNRSSAGQP